MFDILRDGVAISSFGKSHRQHARGPRTLLENMCRKSLLPGCDTTTDVAPDSLMFLRSFGCSNNFHRFKAMPKKTYPKSLKAKSKGPWPTPKRGKRRANIKKPASKTMKSSTTVSYVRHGEVTTKSRAHRARWGHSIQNFSAMPYKKLVQTLQRDGIIPKWKGQVCPRCGMGKLSKLKFVKTHKTWMHQCSSRGCKKYCQPDDFHPIFFRGAGSSVTPLHVQVCIFYAALAGVSVNSAHLIFEHRPQSSRTSVQQLGCCKSPICGA